MLSPDINNFRGLFIICLVLVYTYTLRYSIKQPILVWKPFPQLILSSIRRYSSSFWLLLALWLRQHLNRNHMLLRPHWPTQLIQHIHQPATFIPAYIRHHIHWAMLLDTVISCCIFSNTFFLYLLFIR